MSKTVSHLEEIISESGRCDRTLETAGELRSTIPAPKKQTADAP